MRVPHSLSLLGARFDRPRRRSAGNNRKELPPAHFNHLIVVEEMQARYPFAGSTAPGALLDRNGHTLAKAVAGQQRRLTGVQSWSA